MKVLMLGAGAVGGYYGARLVQGGADVTFLVRPARASQLGKEGLVVRDPARELRVPVRHVTAAQPGHDLVVLACKAYDLPDAIESIAPAVDERTMVMPLVNGVAHFEALDRRFGRERVLGGSCHLIAQLEADGAVRLLANVERIVYGVRPGNGEGARKLLEELQRSFSAAGVNAVLSRNVMQEVWDKYVLLCAFASLTCLMRASVGDIAATDRGRDFALEIAGCCAKVAAAEGYPLSAETLKGVNDWVTQEGSPLTASMLRDIERGGRIEGEHIIGDMLRRAGSRAIEAGLLAVAHCHIQAYERRRARERGG